MAHGALIAVHAVHAAAAKARARVLDAFRVRGVTAPERALPLAELGIAANDDALVTFIASGVIRGVDSRGRLAVLGDEYNRIEGYYLDEQAYITERDRAAGSSGVRAALIAIGIALLIAISLLFLVRSRA